MKVSILLGSVRKGRQSHHVAFYLQKQLHKKGLNVDLIDLAEEALPILEMQTDQQPQLQEKIAGLSERLHEADALIIVSPEYHGSFSGVLKNALDYFWAEFSKKPIGVVTVSSGKMGGINASTQLQHVILSLGAFALPLKLLVPEVQLAFNSEHEPQHERIAKSAEKFLSEFVWFSQALVQAKSRPEKAAA